MQRPLSEHFTICIPGHTQVIPLYFFKLSRVKTRVYRVFTSAGAGTLLHWDRCDSCDWRHSRQRSRKNNEWMPRGTQQSSRQRLREMFG
ncbi:hypothetical protein FKM82_004675 [Ascaphus truei]